MPRLLPERITKPRRAKEGRSCPSHRAWVRRHRCSVPGCEQGPIECAHVRSRTDGGMALKPSDRWAISLCCSHHAEQHRIGESAFAAAHGLDLHALAESFARLSPHFRALRGAG